MASKRACPLLSVKEIDKLKSPSEMPHQWTMRREFLLAHRGKFELDRLLSLSFAYINIKCLGSVYPDSLMEQIEQLSCSSGMTTDSKWVDEYQDIARSSYADMLNDDERNKAYDEAIRKCVFTLVNSKNFNPTGDRDFKCCDIGTGSGLLSMMVARAFQSLNYEKFHITAYEAFQPMAQCAKRVIESNNLSKFITVIPKRSDEGDDEIDATVKNLQFNLLVAELLDTELIGEGCLDAYRHAVENLCSPNCLFVPHQARIYIEPISSSLLFKRHAVDDLNLELEDSKQVVVNIPGAIKECCGNPAIDDMQASMLRKDKDFIRISEPLEVFRFTFNDINSLKLNDYVQLEFPIRRKIDQPPVIAMWWDIVMYDKSLMHNENCREESDIDLLVLSCAPTWARDEDMLRRDQAISAFYNREVWREHWIQGIYYFGDVVGTRKLVHETPQKSHLTVHAYHDTHSLWFNLVRSESPACCSCGVHRALSRSQLAFLGDRDQMSKLVAASWTNEESHNFPIKCEIQFNLRPAGVGGGSCGEPISTGPQEDPKWQLVVIGNNGCSFKTTDSLVDPAINSEIPWESVMAKFINHKNMDPVESFEIKCTQVYFENLNRIRTDRKECEGFKLDKLDELINESSKLVDNVTESHYLWEYGGKRLDSQDHVVFSSKLGGLQTIDKVKKGCFQRKLLMSRRGSPEMRRGWALVFWVEFKLINTCDRLSTGPMQKVWSWRDDDNIEWNRNCKQMVYFLHDKHHLRAHQSSFQAVVKLLSADLHVEVKSQATTRH